MSNRNRPTPDSFASLGDMNTQIPIWKQKWFPDGVRHVLGCEFGLLNLTGTEFHYCPKPRWRHDPQCPFFEDGDPHDGRTRRQCRTHRIRYTPQHEQQHNLPPRRRPSARCKPKPYEYGPTSTTHVASIVGDNPSTSSTSSAIAGALGGDQYPPSCLSFPPASTPIQPTCYTRGASSTQSGITDIMPGMPTFNSGGMGGEHEYSLAVQARDSPGIFSAGSSTPSGSTTSTGSRKSDSLYKSSRLLHSIPTSYIPDDLSLSYQHYTHDKMPEFDSKCLPSPAADHSNNQLPYFDPTASFGSLTVSNSSYWNQSSTVGSSNISLPEVDEQRSYEYGPPNGFGSGWPY